MKGICQYLFFGILILHNLFISAHAQNLSVVYSNNPSFASYVPTVDFYNVRFISCDDFAKLFDARTYYNEQNKKTIIYLDEKIIKVSAFNPFFIVDQKVFQLPVQTTFYNNQIYLPFNYFIDTIIKIFPNRVAYNKWNDQLMISNLASSNISKIEVEEKVNGTLIKIATTRSFSNSELSLRYGQSWLYVDLYGGKVDSASLYQEFKRGLIIRVVPSQISENLAHIGFQLRDVIEEKQMILQNPNLILVSIRTKKDQTTEITRTLEKEKKKWLIDKIVIDPGHGGKDPGATGKYGTKEKDVVLAIAQYLRDLLEEELNIEVLMTREDDRFLELRQRTEFANRNQAKLFISIHANSNPSRKIRGVSTYFLGIGNTDEAREVANLENSVIKLENESKYADLINENFILSAIAQNVYNKESQDLAAMVQQTIAEECDLHDLGVRQAGFYVLWGASMPNILVETAFISNPDEERLLRNRSFQQKQALAIFRSIKDFKERYESAL